MYRAIVTHPNSKIVRGDALALQQQSAREKAAENALASLKQSLNNDAVPLIQGDAEVEKTSKDTSVPTQPSDTTTLNSTATYNVSEHRILQIMKHNFKYMLIHALDLMKDDFNKKVTALIDTAVSDKIKNSISNEIKNSVLSKIEETTKSVATDKITTKFKEELIKQIEPGITTKVLSECTKSVEADVKKKVNEYTEEAKKLINTDTTTKLGSYDQKAKNAKEAIEQDAKKYKQDLKHAYDGHLLQLQTETSTHLTTIDNNTFDAVTNIQEVSNAQTDVTIAKLHTEVETALNSLTPYNVATNFRQNTTTPPIQIGDTVLYKDPYTDTKIEVMISAVHTDNTHIPYYTIAFKNGKEKRTSIECLTSTKSTVDENGVVKCARFGNVDTSLLGPRNTVQ